jgi:hypothetical protein
LKNLVSFHSISSFYNYNIIIFTAVVGIPPVVSEDKDSSSSSSSSEDSSSSDSDDKSDDSSEAIKDKERMLCNVIVRATHDLRAYQSKSADEIINYLEADCNNLENEELIEQVS